MRFLVDSVLSSIDSCCRTFYIDLSYINKINVKRKFHPLYSRISKKKHDILMSNAQNAESFYRIAHFLLAYSEEADAYLRPSEYFCSRRSHGWTLPRRDINPP